MNVIMQAARKPLPGVFTAHSIHREKNLANRWSMAIGNIKPMVK
jgi:hypothetical protein